MSLDARHVSMLQAMGVHVWQAPTQVSLPAAPAAPAAQASRSPAAAAETAPRSPPALRTHPDQGFSSLGWTALQEAVRDCRRCSLCDQRKQTVFGTGIAPDHVGAPPRVDWLIVGEAPGEQEDIQGEPFVGPAGKLLDNMLAALGLARHASESAGVYIANTVKCRPPGNRNPSVQELAMCAPFLQRQIELLQPRVIVAMGRFAAQSLLAATVDGIEKVPLGQLRGQRHLWRDIPVVVTYHPAYLLRNLADKAKAWEDLVRARQVLQERG